jgi:hypothetical protein
LLVARAAAAASIGDPTAPGPYRVGFTRVAMARQATLTDAARILTPVVWYPAEVHDEPASPSGFVDAALRRDRHPVLVYSHGGCAYPEASSFLTKALASWGFVVVAPHHPGDTFLDGLDVCDLAELRAATLVERVADVRAVFDQLGRMSRDPASPFFRRVARTRAGVLGWSSGASTAIVVGRDDRRVRAVLSLAPDARPERIGTAPVGEPTMVMEGELDFYDPAQTALDQVYGILQPPRFAVHLRRTGHFAFSDVCVADLVGGDDCGPGTLTQDEAHRIVLRFAVPFLRRWVAGERGWAQLLRPATASSADAELRAERRRRGTPRREPAY